MSANRKDQGSTQAAASGERDPVMDLLSDFRVVAALVRTAFSSEQTLMSWMRTSLSLFTFGFTITQFFHYLDAREEVGDSSPGPRRLGLALVVAGIVVLVVATLEHVLRLRKLQERGLPKDTGIALPIGSAATLFLIGAAALVTILSNWYF